MIERDEVVDVIVIGSGYGAGVCAARLAEAGAKVCVLERGREFMAGQFPAKLGDILDNVQMENAWFSHGRRLGLYNFYVGGDLDVVVGCGLGGTSLINANVMIEPDRRVFFQAMWPSEIRDEAGEDRLRAYFTRAWDVLRPARYPADRRTPRKLAAMEDSGGERCYVNVHFDDAPTNSVGVPQQPCISCGDCVTGCNHAAKKTLCFTYLPIARSFGARIFVQCDVQHLARRAGLWEVHFQRLETGREPTAATSRLRAKAVIVGAGVMGTTGILLRSRALGLPLSSELGSRVSGNGDAFAYAYDCDDRLDSVGTERPDPRHPSGPTILGLIDRRGDELQRGFVLEEGAFPSGTAAGLRRVLGLIASYRGQETRHGVGHWLRERLAKLQDLLGVRTGEGALNRTLLFLLMGHDGAEGGIELDEHGHAKIRWPQLRDRELFTAELELVGTIAQRLGGMFIKNPLETPLIMNNPITVHPLGGCPMGDGGAGCVDHAGRVRGPDGAVQAGLYVADGSVIPTSLGVNPLWTISALAERIAAHATVDLGLAPSVADVRVSSTLNPRGAARG